MTFDAKKFWEDIEAKNDEQFGAGKWHCDDIWEAKEAPECVIKYLDVERAPADVKFDKPAPSLFAKHNGKRVRVVMASRFGDVGITHNLKAERGYDKRLYLSELTDFTDHI